MTDDYHTFTDRVARNFAMLRAEQEEWEEEQRRAQPPQQPQSISYQLPLTDAQLIRRIDERIDKAVRDSIGPYISRALDVLVDNINQANRNLKEALASECEKNAKLRDEVKTLRTDNNGFRDEIGGLRADLTITRTILSNRDVMLGIARKEAKKHVA